MKIGIVKAVRGNCLCDATDNIGCPVEAEIDVRFGTEKRSSRPRK